jgi:hypothetical protein
VDSKAEWPTWTAARIFGAIALIVLGLAVGLVGWFFAAMSFFFTDADLPVLGIARASGLVFLGAMLGGLPAGGPFLVVSLLRRKPIWSWLAAVVWLTSGALILEPLSSCCVYYPHAVAIFLALIGVAGALGWIAARTIRGANTRPKTDIGLEG